MRYLTGVAVALWLGAMGFFAFVSAPSAFAVLDREAAGRYVAAVFPRYYGTGVVLGLVALVGAAGLRHTWSGRAWGWMPAVLLAGMLALTLYAWLAVLPAAHAAREALRQSPAGSGSAEAQSFARLHRLSAILNGTVMLAGVIVLVLLGVHRP